MRFRLLAPSGQVLDEGDGEVRIEGGALVVTPRLGQPIRVRPLDVTRIEEPAPYFVQLWLAEGPALELSQLGALRTQVLAQFADARTEQTVDSLLLAGVGTPTHFPGAVDGIEAQLRLYDDALVAIPVAGEPRQVLYSFVDDIGADATGYKITVSVAGADPLVVQRLAARTSEFVKLLHDRVNGARVRSATLVSTLLPGLPTLASRAVAGLLRDGVPAAVSALDGVEAGVSEALVRATTLPERIPCVAALAQRGELYLALHQRSSVEVGGSGAGGSLARPDTQVREHGGAAAAPGGLGGVLTGALLRDGPNLFGIAPGAGGLGMGGVLGAAMVGQLTGAFGGGGLLGPGPRGSGAPDGRSAQPRHAPEGGDGLGVPHTDHAQLGTSGGEPSALGLAFAVVPQHRAVVYEVLNDPDHASYVYDLPSPARPPLAPPSDGVPADGVRTIAAALAAIGYRVSAVYADADGADSRYRDAVARLPHLAALREGFRGRAIHGGNWETQLDALLRAR